MIQTHLVDRATTVDPRSPEFCDVYHEVVEALREPSETEDAREAGRLLAERILQRLLDAIMSADTSTVHALLDRLRRSEHEDTKFMLGLLPSARLRLRANVIEEIAEAYLRKEAVVRRKSHPGGADESRGDFVVDTSFALRGDTRFRSLAVNRGAVLNQGRHWFVVDEWSHVEGRIVSVGWLRWQFVKLGCWLKRKLRIPQ